MNKLKKINKLQKINLNIQLGLIRAQENICDFHNKNLRYALYEKQSIEEKISELQQDLENIEDNRTQLISIHDYEYNHLMELKNQFVAMETDLNKGENYEK